MTLLNMNTGKRQRVLGDEPARHRPGTDGLGGHVFNPFVGESRAIRSLAGVAERVAKRGSSVLLLGETGTGKGVLAAWLHRHSRRAAEPFVDLNCAGLSAEFLASELFGHERGSFTGALTSKPGLLEIADQGTVLLDEIGDLDGSLQPKLLKVIEEKRFRRLGGVQDRRIDVCLIAATHRNLPQMVREERFRADLYFRISTFPLVLPALRDRREDIPLLVASLLATLAVEKRGHPLALTPAAERALQRYPWPGNIRELRNVLERAVLHCPGDVIDAADLAFDAALGPSAAAETLETGAQMTLEDLARRHIRQVLAASGGDVARAAQILGIPKSSLYQKIKRYGFNLWELKAKEP
jgi:transcriptional regulator with PAS, ATPase and Fis domain